MIEIGVTGGSGLVGSALQQGLTAQGIRVRCLVRREARSEDEIAWQPTEKTLDPSKLATLRAVVHLAGEPILGRWTDDKRRRILDSRVVGTKHIADALAQLDHKCTLVSASAIGFYGSSLRKRFTEEDGGGEGFLADVCRQWESATTSAQEAGQRVVCPRIGIVLSPKGGALKQMLLPFRAGLGGVVGSGAQWMSWISLRDTVQILTRCALDEALQGPVNCVAPTPATNRDFTKVLARVLKRPAVIPVPSFGLKLLYGKMADDTVLASHHVKPKVLQSLGHEFLDTDLETTLHYLLR